MQTSTGSQVDVAGVAAKVVYYVILLVVLVVFFNVLDLEQVSGTLKSLVDQVLAFVPKLIAAGVLILVAWILASLLRTVVGRTLARTRLDERLAEEAQLPSATNALANILFWLVILLFVPAVLGTLGLHGLLEPVQGMVDKFLAMLPNIVAATVIALVGLLVARILRSLVTNLVSATRLDRLGARMGLAGSARLSALVGVLVYLFVLVPALIAAFDALRIQAVSGPATDMLRAFLDAVPNILGAAVILAVAYFIGRLVASIVQSLLTNMNFDTIPGRIGMARVFSAENTASVVVGRVVVFFVMLFAVVEASARLGFEQMAGIVSKLIEFGGDLLLGIVIITVGFWLSNLAHTAMSGIKRARGLAGLVRLTIIGLVLAMGLRAMGVANDIVNLAFGLTLGAAAVAFALSFGLGGRQEAGEQMGIWLKGLRADGPDHNGDKPVEHGVGRVLKNPSR
jgi:hypothetical protein